MKKNTPDQLNLKEVAEIKHRSVSGAASYFLRTILLQGIGFLSLAIISGLFSPEDFGIYGFVVMIIGLLTFFSDIGLAAALVQKKTEPTVTDYRTAFTVQQILSWFIVGISVALVISNVVSAKTGPAGNWILLSLALSFPLATVKTIPSVILERKLQFSKLVVPQIVEQLLFHSVLIVLAVLGYGVSSYAYAVIIRSIGGVGTMILLQRWDFGFSLNRASIISLFSFGVKFQLNDVLARIKDQLFYIVVGFYLPLREFGYVQWAKNWSMYPYTLTVQNIMAVTFPTFSRLQNDKQRLAKGVEVTLFWITIVLFPILVVLSIFIHPLLIVFESTYGKWQPAALSFSLFTLGIAWSAISTPLTNVLNAIGKINKTLKLMIMWTVLTWTLSPLFIFFWGYLGVALSALVISFSSYVAVIFVKRELDLSLFKQIYAQSIASLGMAVVALLGIALWEQSLVWLVFGVVLSLATYTTIVLLLAKKLLVQNVTLLLDSKKKPS